MNRPKGKRLILYCGIVVLLLVSLFPLATVLLYSFRPPEVTSPALSEWIGEATLVNYRHVLTGPKLEALLRSFLISLGTVGICLILGAPAAYGFACGFKGGTKLLGWVLSIRMLPPITALLPFFIIISKIGLNDSMVALVWLYSAFNLPLGIWIMGQFFLQIPREYEEAAMVEGCGRMRVFLSIALPLCSGGVITSAIITFIFAWNEFLFAVVLAPLRSRTLPAVLMDFLTPFGIQWGEMYASLILLILPPMFFAVVLRRYLVQGFRSLIGGGLRS